MRGRVRGNHIDFFKKQITELTEINLATSDDFAFFFVVHFYHFNVYQSFGKHTLCNYEQKMVASFARNVKVSCSTVIKHFKIIFAFC